MRRERNDWGIIRLSASVSNVNRKCYSLQSQKTLFGIIYIYIYITKDCRARDANFKIMYMFEEY